jgi:Mce-associated membrane protein
LVNAVLVVLAAVLVAATVVFLVQARSDAGGGAAARSVSRQYKAVTSAATRESLAFLDVDYKAMDPRIAKVLAGATGPFKTQYSGATSSLKSSAVESQAVSTGKVLSVGVSDLTSKSAVVFVAANSHVTNKSTKGKAQPRYYRLKLTMVRSGSAWLTSDLEFVG